MSSPSTARFDRVVKWLRYQRQGIPEYWIVDLDSRLFERWLPRDERPEILYERIAWAPDAAKGSLTADAGPLRRGYDVTRDPAGPDRAM